MRARTRGLKEGVQVEFVELPGAGYRHQLVWHLIREQTQLRQRAVGVPLGGVPGSKFFLGALFIRVSPIEDLFLNELASGQCPEGGAGEVEVCLGGDGKEL